jgi:hypothetical protein
MVLAISALFVRFRRRPPGEDGNGLLPYCAARHSRRYARGSFRAPSQVTMFIGMVTSV